MDTVLTVMDLSVAFGPRDVVRDVGLNVMAGETVGLLGPNGAGKSTVLHSIVGLAAPRTGDISVCGAPAHGQEGRDQTGFAPDDLPTPLSLTGAETLALVRRLRGARFDGDLALWLAARLHLTAHLGLAVGGYSHGMRRKLQLICALAHRPRLLILDEPMRGLDPEAGAVLHTLIEVHLAQGGGVLLATHDLDGAPRYCHRVVVIADGEVVAEGTPGDVERMAPGSTGLGEAFLALTGLAERVDADRDEIRRRFGWTPREVPSC